MISLYRYPMTRTVVEGVPFWVLKVKATSNNPEIPSSIFVYHAAMNDDLYEGDVFEAICSNNQLDELPDKEALASIEGKVIPYYRSDEIECLVNTPRDVAELWADIVEDVQELNDQFQGVTLFFNKDLSDQNVYLTCDDVGVKLNLDGQLLSLSAK